MVVTTGDLRQNYEILDVVTGTATKLETITGWSKQRDLVLELAKADLVNKAKRLGADAVIGYRLEYSYSVYPSSKREMPLIDIIAYGTAVKLL